MVITAPVDKSTYIAVNGHSAPVEVKYTTQKDNQPDNTSFCFEINRVLFDADSKYLEGCFEDDNRPLTINEVEVGDYEFISYLKDAGDKNLASTVSHIMFSVVSYKDAVPRILLHSVPLHVLSGEEHTAEVSLSYTLETSVLDSKKFNVCMWITSDSSANKMDKECVSSAQMDLVLKGMTSGDHTLHAALQPVGQSELVESSIVSTVIRVAELSIVPLKLALVGYDSSDGASAGSYSLEFVVDAADPIKIRLAIQGPKAAISKSLVCLMIDGNLAAAAAAAEVREYSRDSCYPALTTDEFTIQRNAPGRYAISFYLLPAVATGGGGKADVPSSVLQVRVEVHKQEEFVPTYDWQPLRPWHSIPAGIETR